MFDPESTFSDLAKRLCRDEARYVAQLAQEFAPVRTGTLRDSIRTGPAPDGDGWAVYVDAPYWRYVEYGTETRGSAQPFIRKALDVAMNESPHLGRGGFADLLPDALGDDDL